MFGMVITAPAVTLFSENFESDLSAWTGKSGGNHHGQIVSDPLDSGNKVLNFTALNAGGDIFTATTFDSTTSDDFILSFYYLGLDTGSGTPDNLGGFIGYSEGLPGSHHWLGGTGGGYPDLLPDTGQWEQVIIPFTVGGNIHLMLEDFSGSGGIAGDAYFDNIVLTDLKGTSPVPVPGTILLFSTGLAGLAGVRLRNRKK